MKYKTVIFDLDGTLLDTLQDLTNSVNFALHSMQYPERSLAEVRMFVGNGISKLIERAVPEGTDEQSEKKTLQIFKSHYEQHCEDYTAPYPGVYELLSDLKEMNVHMAIVSNKADFAVKKLCKKYFSDYISLAIGECDGVRKKPAPDTVFAAIAQLNAQQESTVYIGDSDVDIETARNAKIDSVSVTWGFRDEDFLLEKGASVCVDSAVKLKSLLLK